MITRMRGNFVDDGINVDTMAVEKNCTRKDEAAICRP